MNLPPLQFALVGCGGIAPTHADALAALSDVRLVACCDSVPEQAAAFAQKQGLRVLPFADMLSDPAIEAVTVCVPSGLHAEMGTQALAAGKHVILEKPMDVTLAACDRLIAATKDAGRTLSVISQHRFDPAALLVRETVQRGGLGALIMADARIPWYRTQEYYDSGDWRGTYALDGGGALMNQGIHTVDLMRWLCGPVQSVYAQTRTAAHARIEVEDVACATLTFASGAIGTLTASTALYPGFAARLAVYGTQGSAVIEGDTLNLLAVQGRDTLAGQYANIHALQVAQGGTKAATEGKARDALTPASAASDPAAVWGEAHRAQLADFIHCCRTGQTPIVDGAGARAAVEIVLAVYESARTGQAVTL